MLAESSLLKWISSKKEKLKNAFSNTCTWKIECYLKSNTTDFLLLFRHFPINSLCLPDAAFLVVLFFLCAKEESASRSWYPVSNSKAGSNGNENTNICKNAALM